ncbi:MAG: hypothetical protein U0838_02040 [Chloroflexota bacterium]
MLYLFYALFVRPWLDPLARILHGPSWRARQEEELDALKSAWAEREARGKK